MSSTFQPCRILTPPDPVAAAEHAIAINPANRVSRRKVRDFLRAALRGTGVSADATADGLEPQHLAALTSKLWPATGVKLTVSFPFDQPRLEFQQKVVSYANKWRTTGRANVEFVLTTGFDADVRVNLDPRAGYSSYVGTDIRTIPRASPTMWLGGFTLQMPDSEYDRAVVHEFGHTLGFVHEHLRPEIVARIDRQKAIAYFQANQGWPPATTIGNVLTPLNPASIRATAQADTDSVMCYQLPGEIMSDGKDVRGGSKIDAQDAALASSIYPLPDAPPPKPDPPPPVKPEPPPIIPGGNMLKMILALLAQLRSNPELLKLILDLLGSLGKLSDTQAQALQQLVD